MAWFKSFLSRDAQPEHFNQSDIPITHSPDGFVFGVELPGEDTSKASIQGLSTERDLLVRQLLEEQYVFASEAGPILPWFNFYRLTDSQEYRESLHLLSLPKIEAWRPALQSRGSLTDKDFSVVVVGWKDPEGNGLTSDPTLGGPVIQYGNRRSIVPESVWIVLNEIARLKQLPASNRSADDNRRAWAQIRKHAQGVADLSDFLRKTVVLTPDRLRLDLRRSQDGHVVELQPGFDGEPARWLEVFDRLPAVPDRYEIPDGQGLVHVLLTPEVRTVLSEIRRMPGRRVSGKRAEAFIRNPFATLGPDAGAVLDSDQFESSRKAAGISFARFVAQVKRDPTGNLVACGILIEESWKDELRSEKLWFKDAQDVDRFIAKVSERLNTEAQCCHWEGFDLELLGDTPDQIQILREAVAEMLRLPRVNQWFDLSEYSDRIEGFGSEKPYYSPFIARKSDGEGWFPENILSGILFTGPSGQPVAVPLNSASRVAFETKLKQAQEAGASTFEFPGFPEPIDIRWAEQALTTIHQAEKEVRAGTFKPEQKAPTKTGERKGLVVKANIDALQYEELRGALYAADVEPEVPSSLLPDVALKEHQLVGLGWLQHLYSLSPAVCRGALLADDMGLGKTIQLLSFIASVFERDPNADPFLVIAPVSLLDNWKEEIDKFFTPGSLRVLTLYGPGLARKRIPKSQLENELRDAGLTRLLVPNWLGDAQVVLTTYETLRDLEFSLARQRWSAMICDEAQKIKNPNALVTRAAKKQNARFKIACTGTPVENTLTDLWCLFDLVQPGLLGALKEFGDRYRRPIEAETEEDKARVEELRALIEPQKLRRMKSDVAKDLPRKIEVVGCQELPISQRQLRLYADAVRKFRSKQSDDDSGPDSLLSPLGLLQYLRRLCSDPRPPGLTASEQEPIAAIEQDSPKMKWLLEVLGQLKQQGEKVIVFCEFRDLQRTIQRAIAERFRFIPDVINGDTSADSGNAENRQHRIRRFQERPGFGVIVLSPLAVGFGVNIQAANHVIHFTRTWNPAKEDQATDRAYRIGQKKDVYVYYPIVVAPDFKTFDVKLHELLARKRDLSADMLNGTGDVEPADFSDLGAPDGEQAFSPDTISSEARI